MTVLADGERYRVDQGDCLPWLQSLVSPHPVLSGTAPGSAWLTVHGVLLLMSGFYQVKQLGHELPPGVLSGLCERQEASFDDLLWGYTRL